MTREEQLEIEREENREMRLFNEQAVYGTKEDVEEAYDEDGNFRCINWFDCQYCPAKRQECFE